MNRLLVLALSTAGLIISWRSSLQSRRIAGEARQGSGPAGRHFTQTRYARLFGLWNSDLGIAYYSLVGAAAAAGLLRRSEVRRVLLPASFAAALTSVVLLASLVRLRVVCRSCLEAHAVNFALLYLVSGGTRRRPG